MKKIKSRIRQDEVLSDNVIKEDVIGAMVKEEVASEPGT